MTESQRIIGNWRANLKAKGWPEEAIREIVHDLCEAGYRAAIEEIQERATQASALVAKVAKN
jgi:hypothetical protein